MIHQLFFTFAIVRTITAQKYWHFVSWPPFKKETQTFEFLFSAPEISKDAHKTEMGKKTKHHHPLLSFLLALFRDILTHFGIGVARAIEL